MPRISESRAGAFENRLGYHLRRVDVLMMDALGKALAEVGLTPARATALEHVGLDEGCDQTALGRALGINAATTMGAVNALVALGAVERRRGDDRRSNSLFLTTAGKALREDAERIVRGFDEAFFAGLTAQERAHLLACLRKIRTNRNSAAAAAKQPALRLRRVK